MKPMKKGRSLQAFELFAWQLRRGIRSRLKHW